MITFIDTAIDLDSLTLKGCIWEECPHQEGRIDGDVSLSRDTYETRGLLIIDRYRDYRLISYHDTHEIEVRLWFHCKYLNELEVYIDNGKEYV